VSTDAEIIDGVRRVFATRQRPDHFTNHNHCDECAEHDEVLRCRDTDTLSIDDVGNPGWDPICFISPDGFAWYLPALVRLALAQPAQPAGWYGPQLLFHLCSDGPRNERILACTPEQRQSIVGLLEHILDTRVELVERYQCGEALLRAIERWSEPRLDTGSIE
jgi:hypothetical protein